MKKLFQKNKSPNRCVVLNEIREQCIQHIILILQGKLLFDLDEQKYLTLSPHKNDPILKSMVMKTLPRGFMVELVANTCQNPDLFHDVSVHKY